MSLESSIAFFRLIFLFGILKSDYIRHQIDKKVKGIAQKTLNLKDLKDIQILLPPIKKQKKFAIQLENIQNIKIKYLISDVDLVNLFNSLMQKAFKGELEFN